MDRRRTPRFKTRYDTLFGAGAHEGTGTLTDISYSGAMIEGATQRPPIGAQVRLYVFVKPVAPFELVGHVARHTENGFALQYELFDADVQRLVDDVSALVAAA
jgi:hypothetical protein